MNVEAVLLTGGASRRMGVDKSGLMINGEAVSYRIARSLQEHCIKVSVLGREPIDGFHFLADEAEFAGPLTALSRFVPSADLVFVASCDLPRFDARLIPFLTSRIEDGDAILPEHKGRVQPLCGMYASRVWGELVSLAFSENKSIMAWMDRITYRTVTQDQICQAGIDPRSIQGANSPDEWAQLTLE